MRFTFRGTGAAKGVTPSEFFIAVQNYIHFHLFKNRPPDCKKQKPPDFHQTLGLLGKYPYLLRPLGLVYDFRDVAINTSNISAPGPATNGLPTIAIEPPKVDGIRWVRMQSVYTDPTTFQMASRSITDSRGNAAPMHINRCLALGSDFSLITEDTDGTSHKVTQQQQAAARHDEYQTPTPAGSKSGSAAPNPVEAVPSARTAGLGLYHDDRVVALAQLLQSSPDPEHPAEATLYLEDVTLGYRADIRIDPQNTWSSLHQRKSTYAVKSNGAVLSPNSQNNPLEADADEGFISLSATQSTIDQSSGDPDLQVQIHESVLVWTGFSLSVPRPGSYKVEDTVNGAPKNKPDCPNDTLPDIGFCSDYKVKPGTQLPKLRFGNVYSMRLRHVDLAGNSIASTDPAVPGTEIVESGKFSRLEPLRAPQILLETPIDRRKCPGDQSSTMVVRDNSEAVSRRLVPPREPLRLAEMYDKFTSAMLPNSAFYSTFGDLRPNYLLMPNGAFPKVSEACEQDWISSDSICESSDPSVESSDAILLPRGSVQAPKVPYYPDPAVNYVRIEPQVLQQDLCTYTPWLQDADTRPDSSSLPAYYAHVYPFEPWPNAVAMRIVVNGVSGDQPLRFNLDMLSERSIGSLPTIPTLTVDVPEAYTVMLQLSSATVLQQPTSPILIAATNRLALTIPAPRNPPPTGPTLPANMAIGLGDAILALKKDLSAMAPREPANSARERGATSVTRFALAVRAPNAISQIDAAVPQDKDALDGLLADGTIRDACPQRSLTLVHAVHKPLFPPDFSGDTCGSEFIVTRAAGATQATVRAKFSAHWMSTAKVICTASWTDQIDDPTKTDLASNSPQPEVAFEYLNQNSPNGAGKATPSFRDINSGQSAPQVHRFRDTRARKVRYTLSACPRFSEFYAEDKVSQVAGERCCIVQVNSSARPPAPTIAYILPAFSWQNTHRHTDRTWQRGRTMVLRVYLDRPFLVSGDEECIGVVLAAASGKSSQAVVSQWGTDPILNNEYPLHGMNMTTEQFVCAPEDVQKDCLSFEDEQARAANTGVDVIPFPVHFSRDRKLWYCDIPLGPSLTPSAFARLALVRWQPHALKGSDGEARLSQVVVADFMQISPDRWVSVKKISTTKYSVCVSGVFRNPHKDKVPGSSALTRTISCSVEQRWHRLGEDLGWRPVCVGPTFRYSDDAGGANGKNLSQWQGDVDLPYSSTFHKFRLLLEEHEWLSADNDKTYLKPGRLTQIPHHLSALHRTLRRRTRGEKRNVSLRSITLWV